MHHKNVGSAVLRMAKRARDLADNLKSVALPQAYGDGIGRHDTIELHRRKACAARLFKRVLAHRRSNALTAGRRRHHVAAIGDVIA